MCTPERPISRRSLFKGVPLGALALVLAGRSALRRMGEAFVSPFPAAALPEQAPLDPHRDEGGLRAGAAPDRVHKNRDFDRTYADDILLEGSRLDLLASTAARLERAVGVIGHGNFNLVAFDDLLRYARNYSRIGAFTRPELDFLDEMFDADAERYGFYGEKVIERQTAQFDQREVKLIDRTGHYLLRGESLGKYERIRRDLGDSIVLTSGVRGVVKQYQLFLAKAVQTGGNLSQASRSLAPPGYSYHAIGDFDIGRVGFGLRNFTAEFAETSEYKRLIDLGYVDIRYTEDNPYGVRHEPWHMKIA